MSKSKGAKGCLLNEVFGVLLITREAKGESIRRLEHVDEQRFARATVDRCELIEQARPRSREIGLGGVSDSDTGGIIEREVEQPGDRAQQSDREFVAIDFAIAHNLKRIGQPRFSQGDIGQ